MNNFNIFITSSVRDTIKESANLANELGVGLEVSRLPNMKRIDEDFPSILRELKDATSNFGGKITFHGLFSDLNPASKDSLIKQVTEKRFNQSLEAALEIGAKTLLFHSGHKGMKHTVSVATYIKNSISFWKDFMPQCEKKGIIVVLENVLEDSPKNLIKITDEVNSPNLKICLDTGHANLCSNIPIPEWIKAYGNRLYHMHIHNNYKTNDDHAGIKYGTINFLDVIDTLQSEKIYPQIVFEMFDEQKMIKSIKLFKALTHETF